MSLTALRVPIRQRHLVCVVLWLGLCLTWVGPSSSEETTGNRLSLALSAEEDPLVGRLLAGQMVRSAAELELAGGSSLLLGNFPQGDYELAWLCQARGASSLDLIVFPRCQPCSTGWGVTGPRLILPVARLTSRSRHGVGRKDAPGRPWQQVRLVVNGNNASLWSDGQLVSRLEMNGADRGWIAIGARGCGGAIAILDAQLVETGFSSLFDGVSLDGWEGAGSPAALCWKAEQGCLQCTGAEGPWLRSQKTWTDFELRLEYRVLSGGNSGVYVRVPADGNHHGAGSGVEVQILDDMSPRYRDLTPYQFSASLYAIEAAEPGSALPAGQWNALGIRCVDRRYEITHNGRTVLERDEQQCPELLQRLTSGYLGLQNHSEQVWFRHLRIQVIP
jgi:hypothetical protein